MIKTITVFFTLFFISLHGFGQHQGEHTGPEPIGGVSKVALEYFKINFTKEQRKMLQEIELEFIYSINKEGVASLEHISGIDDEAILDSLQRVTSRLPKFNPHILNGEKVSSLYFMRLQFPVYNVAQNVVSYQEVISYQQARYEDFEYIHKSGERLEVSYGAVTNTFAGNASQYLQWGGGMKVDLMYMGKRGIGGGMVMSFYGNKLKQDYPINSTREQNNAPPTMLLGIAGSKVLKQKERGEFNIQFELDYAIQNIIPRLGNNDPDWVQLKGFSPGLVGNYLIQVGKNKPSFYYGSPSLLNHYINLHGAIRPLFFNLKQASGLMLEMGISYRMIYHVVDEYKLKN